LTSESAEQPNAKVAACARGHAACSVGAFYDDKSVALVGADPAHEWLLPFVALGVPG
jgi:hypothetical protein